MAGSPAKVNTYTLDIIADSTGNLASHLVNAVLTQFPDLRVRKKFHLVDSDKDDLAILLNGLPKRNHLILHALVCPKAKAQVDTVCEKKGIPHFDLTGTLVQFIGDHTGAKPLNEKTRLHRTEEGYFHRIAAMEFTAQHDDSRRIQTAGKADIVILGLSRSSKSPTSTFLGSMGYRVANISLAPELGPPTELKKIAKKKMIGLTMQPRRLHEIRTLRFEEFQGKIAEESLPHLPYGDIKSVIHEVMWVEELYASLKIPVINVTDLTVEQTASSVLKALSIKRPPSDYA